MTQTEEPRDEGPRDTGRAIWQGMLGRCPNCGQGRLFAGYLRVCPTCSVCGAPLGRHRAADGPAFVTITVVGLLLIPILWVGFAAFRPSPWVLALVATAAVGVLTLVVLRLAKGGFVGYLWAMSEVDPGA